MNIKINGFFIKDEKFMRRIFLLEGMSRVLNFFINEKQLNDDVSSFRILRKKLIGAKGLEHLPIELISGSLTKQDGIALRFNLERNGVLTDSVRLQLKEDFLVITLPFLGKCKVILKEKLDKDVVRFNKLINVVISFQSNLEIQCSLEFTSADFETIELNPFFT
jgi:hypothetical protein|nr:MAG TPA: hypothetical protein [Caudoviricetes sp.]